jgi:hypothetical protein
MDQNKSAVKHLFPDASFFTNYKNLAIFIFFENKLDYMMLNNGLIYSWKFLKKTRIKLLKFIFL